MKRGVTMKEHYCKHDQQSIFLSVCKTAKQALWLKQKMKKHCYFRIRYLTLFWLNIIINYWLQIQSLPSFVYTFLISIICADMTINALHKIFGKSFSILSYCIIFTFKICEFLKIILMIETVNDSKTEWQHKN